MDADGRWITLRFLEMAIDMVTMSTCRRGGKDGFEAERWLVLLPRGTRERGLPARMIHGRTPRVLRHYYLIQW